VGLVSSKQLQPGDRVELRVTLDPLGKSGDVTEIVTIASNDPSQPTTDVPVRAMVEHWTSANASETLQTALFGRPECASCHAEPAAGGDTGARLYNGVCAMCHKQLAAYAVSPPVTALDRKALRSWVADGRTEAGMPGYSTRLGGPLSDAQIDSLVDALLLARKVDVP
jgi:mono/diheme cytochrome c family protein